MSALLSVTFANRPPPIHYEAISLRKMQVIVCTSINAPSEAIQRFDEIPDWTLIVVGDKKTPEPYELRNGHYMSPDEQVSVSKTLSDLIGWNSIRRRNFGFVLAHQWGAEVVATVDDDNIPLEGWGTELLVGKSCKVKSYSAQDPAFDPVGATSYEHLWHRGFPIQLLSTRDYSSWSEEVITPAVQAAFWNGDPDVDAICRMEHAPDCDFRAGDFPFTSDVAGPFNSQNTFLDARILPDYFVLPHVGRMDDIWASYFLQALGHRVVYTAPSVYQDRNDHDLTEDFNEEVLGYSKNLQLVTALKDDPARIAEFLPERTALAWEAYRECFT